MVRSFLNRWRAVSWLLCVQFMALFACIFFAVYCFLSFISGFFLVGFSYLWVVGYTILSMVISAMMAVKTCIALFYPNITSIGIQKTRV